MSSYVVGLNQIGLRRAGFSTEAIAELKQAYRVIYRSGLAWKDILEELKTKFSTGPASLFYQFLSTTTRGIIQERRTPQGVTLKLRRAEDEDTDTGEWRVRITG